MDPFIVTAERHRASDRPAMRFLGIADELNLGDMYRLLSAEGHQVRVYASMEASADTLKGLLVRTPNWEAELPWIREAGPNGVIIFESAHAGQTQDRLRHEGYNVIGGSSYGDRLELDREFGQQAMRDAGMQTAPVHSFRDFDAAIEFIKQRPKRYVFKLNGVQFSSHTNHIGELEDGQDTIGLIAHLRDRWQGQNGPDFILMDCVIGVEVGVGAYFNGREFLRPACIDWEHKRFFDNDLGELTGEMGTLVSYRNAEAIFDATLARMAEPLGTSGYVGYINLNTIVNAQGIWPLEFTCRFGYPGFAILQPLHKTGWGEILRQMVQRKDLRFETHPGFSVGVVLTLPPFPHRERYDELSKGLPVLFHGDLTVDDWRHIHFDEVEIRDGKYFTSGFAGYIGVVTGMGESVEIAQRNAYALVRRVVVPNIRYRSDIGKRFVDRDKRLMQECGYWPMTES
jgi:phosphoribosylamine--glycine ligase